MLIVRGPDDPRPDPPPGPPRPAVFLDRDDTLIVNRDLPAVEGVTPGDLADPSRVTLLPGAAEACARLRDAGYALVMYTNQGVVARGGGTVEDVVSTCERAVELLGGQRVIEAVYYCPFHPRGDVAAFAREHEWRKPAGGMVRAAIGDLNLHAAGSWAIGDSARDIDAAIGGGIPRDNCVLLGGEASGVLDAAGLVIERTPAPERAAGVLRAQGSSLLADDATREVVRSAAEALAERTGVSLVELEVARDELRFEVVGPRVVALGFAAELRRATNAWSRVRLGLALWPEPSAGE